MFSGSQRVRVRRGRGRQLEPKSNNKHTNNKHTMNSKKTSNTQMGSGNKRQKITNRQGQQGAKRSRTRLSCSAK